jgi:hypothetical protein
MNKFSKIFKNNGAFNNIKNKLNNKIFQKNNIFNMVKKNKSFNFEVIGASMVVLGASAYMNKENLFFLDSAMVVQAPTNALPAENKTAESSTHQDRKLIIPENPTKVDFHVIKPAGFGSRFLAGKITGDIKKIFFFSLTRQ